MLEIFKALDGKCITDRSGTVHTYKDEKVVFWITAESRWCDTAHCTLDENSKVVPDPSVKTLDTESDVLEALFGGAGIRRKRDLTTDFCNVFAFRDGELMECDVSAYRDGADGWIPSPGTFMTLVGGTVYEPPVDEVCDKCEK